MTLSLDLARLLPRPGPVWGAYPSRAADDRSPPRRPWRSTLLAPGPRAAAARVARQAEAALPRWLALGADPDAEAQVQLRVRLRRDGLTPAVTADALAAAGAAAVRTLGLTPRRSQWLAAAALLDARWVEMATGEGKTLSLALAAAVGALAGMPVHAVTANAYLAQRDAARLAPMYAALGLRVAAATAQDEAQRRAAHRADVVYATAKDLAFDHLRDRQAAARGELPLLRGQCMALLDELDSILLDEAEVPLVLSRQVAQPQRRAFLWQSLALARQLDLASHVEVDLSTRRARLTPAGEGEVQRLAAPLGGPWRQQRYRREVMAVALTALHALRRNLHYVVREGRIELLDEVTGRAADGRQWGRGLHAVVALKEGLAAPAETETVSQTTFQRFFQRYWRLSGLSGTVREARAELRRGFGLGLVQVPLHAPCRRIDGPVRVFDNDAQRWSAVAARVQALRAQGRPTLVGTDSVDASQALSGVLAAAGVPHRVLHALHDADEAAIVAAAGQGGQVTVATRMAGRGTDIELCGAARAAGGLHVINCQRNPSARLDRQLAGRAARHGDPGSAESWFLRAYFGLGVQASPARLTGCTSLPTSTLPRVPWPRLLHRFAQWLEERRRSAWRDELLRQDLAWERRLPYAAGAWPG